MTLLPRCFPTSRTTSITIIFIALLLTQGCTYQYWRTSVCRDLFLVRANGGWVPEKNSEAVYYVELFYGRNFGSCVLPKEYSYTLRIGGSAIPEALRYRGPSRTVQEIIDNVPPSRLDEIKTYKLTTDFDLLENYYELKNSGDTNFFYIRHYNPPVKVGKPYPVGNGIFVVPFLVEPVPSQPADGSLKRQGGYSMDKREEKNPIEPPFDPKCQFILLPAQQQRSAADRSFGVITALLGTPFAVAGDLLLLPMWPYPEREQFLGLVFATAH